MIVDYAHTDDALKNILAVARDFVQPRSGRVITLFGCGGDRDRSKRPLMGQAAGRASDVVVVTSDNPRSEEPELILQDVLPGLKGSKAKVLVEPDRERAIRLAIGEARRGDMVLLAGKGHEKTQVLRDRVIPFDDAAIALDALRALGKAPMKLATARDCPLDRRGPAGLERRCARAAGDRLLHRLAHASSPAICSSPYAASVTRPTTLFSRLSSTAPEPPSLPAAKPAIFSRLRVLTPYCSWTIRSKRCRRSRPRCGGIGTNASSPSPAVQARPPRRRRSPRF